MPSTFRPWAALRVLALAAAAVTMVAADADARAGRGGGGFGSRGARTSDAPPATTTAPRTAAPIQQPGTAAQQPGVAQPGFGRPAAAAPGGFGRGGFMGGLLGAGLIGAVLGYGLFGGLGGLASIIGLLLQVGVVAFLIVLAVRFFRSRFQPAAAGAGALGSRLNREAATPSGAAAGYAGGGLGGGAAGARRPAPAAQPRDDLGVSKPDYDAFERVLDTVQTAYGNGDVAALRAAATPEVVARFERDLAEDAARGVRNRVGSPKLLQGDLAEAWREGNLDYATVAMRFSLVDYTEDRATGRVVEGDPNRPTEATEVWTFARPRGGEWQLSAVQQA